MKFFRKILKNKLFYLVLLLGVFLTPIFKFTLQAQEGYDNNFNLASPNLENKEYLGDGVYRYRTQDGITMDYDVYNGHVILNGTTTTGTQHLDLDLYRNVVPNDSIVSFSYYYVSGTYENDTIYDVLFVNSSNIPRGISLKDGLNYRTTIVYENYEFNYTAIRPIPRIYLGAEGGTITFNNFTFMAQLEKGDTATPYKLPIQALKQHVQLEVDRAYNDGYDDGYMDGFRDGESDGYQYGYEVGEIDGYNDGYNVGHDIGYNQARDDYGYYDVDAGEWITAAERHQEFYDRGYQDGVNDTIVSYNDNGLFIPQSTPKGHLIVEEDLRYGDPYFYLRDFSGQLDSEYFGFEHNRWLEKAFDWAYSVESDFLAINDVYIIKYKNDEVLYKYFFYRHDTDSIYLYNDNGALLKVVERSNFDYFIHEVPELSPEEQDRINQAYDNGYNNAKREYGYYDSQSGEYLTATAYGEIQYNKGVISIRDKAYLDGFYTAMMDSHKYGFDWVRGTYYELIEERPTLQNLRDETSFTHQLAYTQGFNVAREQYGFWNGRVWVTAESIRDLTYTEAYDIGFRDATNELYDDLYDEIYDIGYRAGQQMGMNNKFYTGLEKWLVPAIIVVLFFGFLMLFPRNKED